MALDFIKNLFGKKNNEDYNINQQGDFMNYPPEGPGNFPPGPYPNEPLPPPLPPVQNQNTFQQNQFPGQLNPQAYLPNFPQNYGYNNQYQNQMDYNVIQMLNKYTGINVYPKRYPPGLLTNPALDIFKDVDVVIITDPILDRNALLDAYRTGKITIAFVDTNNSLSYIDIAIPANNRGAKSLALLYYIIAREYLRNRGLLSKKGELPISYEEFMEKGLEEEEE